MKIFALLPLFVGLSASAASLPWQKMNVSDVVKLSQTIDLELGRGKLFRIDAGATYTLESIDALEGLGIADLTYRAKNCANPEMTADLTLVLPLENAPNSKAEVGVYLLRGCALEILIESKDYGKPSFFSEFR